jgi:type VI secretion system secreted protein VgrG
MTNPQELLPAEITVKVPGVKDQLRLHSLRGREGLGMLFEYHLDLVNWDESDIVRNLLTPQGCLSPEALLGKSLTVTLPLAEGKVRHISGLVTQAAYAESIDHHTAYAVTIRPELWLLTLTQSCRVFQDKDVPTVLEEILSQHGLGAPRKAWIESHRTWDTLTQYRESDFAFISRLLAREGFYYFFEHGPEGHTLVLADHSPSAHGKAEAPIIPMGKPKPIAGSEEHLRTWQAGFHLQTEAVTLADFDFRLRRQPVGILGFASAEEVRLGTSSAGSDDPAKGDPAQRERPPWEIYDFPAQSVLAENREEAAGSADPIDSRAQAAELARIRREANRCHAARYVGQGTVRWLTPGMIFMVERSDPQKEFLALETDLTLRNPALLTGESTIGEPCEITVKALDSQTPFRVPLEETPRILGPQTAWVVGEKDEEIWTDKHGRIRVHFHWDRERASEKGSSCWVRVAQPWAGHRYGIFSIPRVGSEVVVEFLYGDPDRPLVTGCVYSAENQPPYDLPDHKTRSGIKTRSSKGATPANFNEIRFEDKKGHEELHIQAERDLTTLVKHDQIEHIHGKRDVEVKNGDSLRVVESNKSATVEGSYEILTNQLFNLLVCKELYSPSSPSCSLDLRDGVVTVDADNEIRLVCGKSSLSLKKDGTIEMNGTFLSLAGSDKIEADGKGATLKLSETVKAEGTEITVTGKQKVHLDGAGAKLVLTAEEAILKGKAVNIN